MRTYVYIDGFSLYYRALNGTPYKWLDLKELTTKLLAPYHEILAIKYFTARVQPTYDPHQPNRQKAYLLALEYYIPEIRLFFGTFLSHPQHLPLAHPSGRQRYAEVIKTEEKGSDVNLAVHLVNDAWRDEYDCAVLLSNDGDLAEAIRLVREQNGKRVGWICPITKEPDRGRPSNALRRHAHFQKKIRTGVLAASQLPDPIPNTNIRKPMSW